MSTSKVFGSTTHYAADEAVSTTSSAVLVTALTTTTPVIPAGTYQLSWFGEIDSDATTVDELVEVDVDGTVVSSITFDFTITTVPLNNLSGMVQLALTNAAHTIRIQHARVGAIALNVSIRRKRLWLYRVA